MEWIEKHQHYILPLLKSFNGGNDIVYIANEEVASSIINIYSVRKDENDVVARRPLEKNRLLNDFFMSFDYDLRNNNINTFNQKQKKKNDLFLKIYRKGCSYLKQKTLHEYVHDKIISHS